MNAVEACLDRLHAIHATKHGTPELSYRAALENLGALTRATFLTRPQQLADDLARHAREARRRLFRQDMAALAPLRHAMEQALGLHFHDREGETFFPRRWCRRCSTASSPAGCCGGKARTEMARPLAEHRGGTLFDTVSPARLTGEVNHFLPVGIGIGQAFEDAAGVFMPTLADQLIFGQAAVPGVQQCLDHVVL